MTRNRVRVKGQRAVLAMLRYPEARSKLPPGSYVMGHPSGVTVRYTKNSVSGEWRGEGREGMFAMAKADDAAPANGDRVCSFDQALSRLLDRQDGLSPLCGNARQNPPSGFLVSVWQVAGTLVAADTAQGAGWGFVWTNPRGACQEGARHWPVWLQLSGLAGLEEVARLAGKICGVHATGVSLNPRDSEVMRDALEATGEPFTESDYQAARALIEGRYQEIRAISRHLVGQFKRPTGHPHATNYYRLGDPIKAAGYETCKNYEAVFDLPEGAVPAACARTPSRRCPEFEPEIHAPLLYNWYARRRIAPGE